MAWVKLDDHFFRNPKVVAAGRDARDLYLAGLCYCGAGLTDGRIPAGALRMLGADADIDDVRGAAQALVDAGLWMQTDSGYLVHDYLNYNPSKDRVLQTREVRADAGSRGGKQRASNLLEPSQAFATENLQAKSNPVPSRPTPVQSSSKNGANAPTGAPAALVPVKASPEFEGFWRAWQTEPSKGHGSKRESYEVWKRFGLDREGADEARQAVMDGLARWQACGRWRRGYVKDCQRWLKDRLWLEDAPADGATERNGQAAEPAPEPKRTPEEQARLDADRAAALAKEREREGTAYERWQRKQTEQARPLVGIPKS